MMRRLSSVLRDQSRSKTLRESDVRHLVENWLTALLRDDRVYCESAQVGKVLVRVPSALLAQEVFLHEYELRRVLREQGDWRLERLAVIQR